MTDPGITGIGRTMRLRRIALAAALTAMAVLAGCQNGPPPATASSSSLPAPPLPAALADAVQRVGV